MTRKNYFIYLTAVALFLAGSLAVFAQTAPTRGKIEFKKADGTTVPAASAVIDVYRTDSKGKLPSGKTNKKGEFAFAGLPVGQIFMLVVSAPEIQTQIFPNIKAGMENVVLTVYSGDGKPMTEEEARVALARPKNTGNTDGGTTAAAANNSSAPAPTKEEIEAAKKAQAEYEKKVSEVNARNEKVKGINEIVNASLKDGAAAFDSKNYDLAITKFTEGVNADPDFVGSAPILLNNKALALRMRAVDAYNVGVKAADAAQKTEKLGAARKDFQESLASYSKSYQILKDTPPANIPDQNNYNKAKYDALSGITEVYRLMAFTRTIDATKSAEARASFQDYMTVETDPARKAKAQFVLAEVFREAGDFDSAVPEYRKALELSPDSPDALAGMGLSLFAVGVSKNDKAKMQEGLNFMERFAQVAPANHQLKASVAEAVTYLKTEQKLTPQKTTPAKRRGN